MSVIDFVKEKIPQARESFKRFKAKKWPKGSIVYYTGNRKTGLTPYSLEEGTSGTHTAVIYLSREWAKLGYQVTVYSNCGDREGIYEGVKYINYYYFNWHDTFDILIILAHPNLLQLPVKARKVCWEWQDIIGAAKSFPMHKIKRFDKIFSKCQFQRNLLPDLPDRQFAISPNGVNKDIAQYYDRPKSPYHLIYASRYYRGLDAMLTYGWPLIKQAIPEAELHIYHGFVRRENLPEQAQWKQQLLTLMKQDGVFDHGRVGQDELIQAKAKASIHYYACTYAEIDCISVRESAMVGCVPVTTDFAVFQEKRYCVRVPGEPKAQETQEAVANKVIELLKDPEKLALIREQFRTAVQHETWDQIAQNWIPHFEFEA